MNIQFCIEILSDRYIPSEVIDLGFYGIPF